MAHQTLHEFARQHNADLGEPFLEVLDVLVSFAKTIREKVQRNGLIAESGDSGETNVYGENVQKLDAFADTALTDALLACPAIHSVGSEEMETPKLSGNGTGIYTLTHDPVDGSSNIDINLPIGTIFGLYPKSDSLLQKGSTQVASGYILYGPSMLLFYAVKGSVNGFTFDPVSETFVLSYENVRIGTKKYFAVNEGNWPLFNDAEKNFLTAIKQSGEYSARYIGSMVGDVHRTLLKGGIFIYPADAKHESGKLRLLYEVAPLSFLITQAGGAATVGTVDPLDLMPVKHNQRVPIALGTKELVDHYRSFDPKGV